MFTPGDYILIVIWDARPAHVKCAVQKRFGPINLVLIPLDGVGVR